MDTIEFKGETFKMVDTNGVCQGCYGFEHLHTESEASEFCDAVNNNEGTMRCKGKIAVKVEGE